MLKPVKHNHAVEISISPEIQAKLDKVKTQVEENKKPYTYGICGVLIGVVGTRLLSRKSAVVTVVVQAAQATE